MTDRASGTSRRRLDGGIMLRMWRQLSVVLVIVLPWTATAQPSTATAPATRAEALEALREARAEELHEEKRGRLERALIYVEEERVLQRLNPPQGFYPVLGSFVRGGGFGLGAGYRRRPAGGRLVVDASGAWTFKDYKNATVTVTAPRLMDRDVEVTAGARWYDFPQEDFFGLGPDTSRVDRVSFALRNTETFGQILVRKAGWLVGRGRIGVHRFEMGRGEDPRFPTAQATFTEATAPAVTGAPTLSYVDAGIGVDTRDQPGNTRGGGLYNVSFGMYRDGGRDAFDFNRVDVKLLHVIPIFDKKRGIALHAAASRIDPIGSSQAPFFLMPTVGGADSLRGFREFRFRDAAAVTLNAEYRWEAFSGLDLALFVDAGDVGPTWRSIAGKDLKSSWGMGFRFNTNRLVFLRLDVAGGREGPRVWIAMGPVFRR